MELAAESRSRWHSARMVCCICAVAVMLFVTATPSIAEDSTVADDSDASAAPEAVETPTEDEEDSSRETVIPFWQLDRGQTFSTKVSVHRETEMHVGEHRQDSDDTDRIELGYEISTSDRAGGFRVGLRVLSMHRESKHDSDASDDIEVLPRNDTAGMEMTFRVANGGELIKPLPGESLLPEHDLETRELLVRLCGPNVFRTWADYPFRVPVVTQGQRRNSGLIVPNPESELPDLEDAESIKPAIELPGLRPGFSWKRPQHVSLGLMGTLKMDCEYRVEGIDGDEAAIVIRGTAEILPTDAPARSMLAIESVDLTVSELSGSGKVLMSEFSGVPESMRFTQAIVIEGTGVVRSGRESHELRFRQSLTQNWFVSEFKYRDEPQGFPIQVPR